MTDEEGPFYDPEEYRLNQIASGVTLFITALADVLSRLDELPPDQRTSTALLSQLVSSSKILGEQEYVTEKSLEHALSFVAQVSVGVRYFQQYGQS